MDSRQNSLPAVPLGLGENSSPFPAPRTSLWPCRGQERSHTPFTLSWRVLPTASIYPSSPQTGSGLCFSGLLFHPHTLQGAMSGVSPVVQVLSPPQTPAGLCPVCGGGPSAFSISVGPAQPQ